MPEFGNQPSSLVDAEGRNPVRQHRSGAIELFAVHQVAAACAASDGRLKLENMLGALF